MDVLGFAWGTTLRKKITLTFGAISAIAGSIVAVPPAWSELGLPEMASKGWVGAQMVPLRTAQNTNDKVLRAIQLDLAEGKRSQTETDLAKWGLELGRNKDPGSKALIQQQIRELEDTRGKLSDQIKTLREMK